MEAITRNAARRDIRIDVDAKVVAIEAPRTWQRGRVVPVAT